MKNSAELISTIEEGDDMSYWSNYPDIQDEMDKVEELLEQSLKSRRKIVEDTSMDLLRAGGKRIRPDRKSVV